MRLRFHKPELCDRPLSIHHCERMGIARFKKIGVVSFKLGLRHAAVVMRLSSLDPSGINEGITRLLAICPVLWQQSKWRSSARMKSANKTEWNESWRRVKLERTPAALHDVDTLFIWRRHTEALLDILL